MFLSGFTIVVIPYLDSYYLFASHSRNGQSSIVPHSKSVLLTFAGEPDMKKYIQVVYLQEKNQNYTYLLIRYVHINISDKNISHILNTFQRFRGATTQQRHREKSSKSQEFKDNVLHNVDKMI